MARTHSILLGHQEEVRTDPQDAPTHSSEWLEFSKTGRPSVHKDMDSCSSPNSW